MTWEAVLGAYRTSQNTWVATSAAAWLEHLDVSLPKVDAGTAWNDLADGEDFAIALRARMSWLHGRLTPPEPIVHDLVSSAAGVSWVVRMYTDAAVSGYQVMVEVEEYLPVRDFPKYAGPGRPKPGGPSIKVCLLQSNVKTSAGFDWEYLLQMWPKMKAVRSDWVRNPPRPRSAHDRSGYQAMVAKGGPPYLGIGFGDAQAKISRTCMFGARIQLPPHTTLSDLEKVTRGLYSLILEMAATKPALAA